MFSVQTRTTEFSSSSADARAWANISEQNPDGPLLDFYFHAVAQTQDAVRDAGFVVEEYLERAPYEEVE